MIFWDLSIQRGRWPSQPKNGIKPEEKSARAASELLVDKAFANKMTSMVKKTSPKEGLQDEYGGN